MNLTARIEFGEGTSDNRIAPEGGFGGTEFIVQFSGDVVRVGGIFQNSNVAFENQTDNTADQFGIA